MLQGVTYEFQLVRYVRYDLSIGCRCNEKSDVERISLGLAREKWPRSSAKLCKLQTLRTPGHHTLSLHESEERCAAKTLDQHPILVSFWQPVQNEMRNASMYTGFFG